LLRRLVQKHVQAARIARQIARQASGKEPIYARLIITQSYHRGSRKVNQKPISKAGFASVPRSGTAG
jgi:hypothetical protein